jgi:GNAT superfamily N-acetyltransferase
MEIRIAEANDWDGFWVLLGLMGKRDENGEIAKQRFVNILSCTNHFIPVAVNNDTLIGYGWVQDYGFHLRTGKKTSRMHDVFVHPDYRNQGVAKALLSTIESWAKQNETSWLQWNSSPSAINFYKKIGHSPIEEENDYPLFEIEF